MTLATIVNRLKAEGTIEQVRVNRYKINATERTRQLRIRSYQEDGQLYTRAQIHALFAVERGGDFFFRTEPFTFSYPWEAPSYIHRGEVPTEQQVRREQVRQERVMRTITRNSYHSSGHGVDRRGVQEALSNIARDGDGVRRSFGLEWEIYSLNEQQEDKLARILETLPSHFTEMDASLSNRGVEIIFLPLSKQEVIRVFNKLKTFCLENRVDMSNTGAHITYGVSNANVSENDLQIRINRIALAVKAACTQQAIRNVFGRDFTGYASLPRSTTERGHSNAWSASRGNSAYELRLCNWQGNIEKITEFMVATEFVFNRVFTGRDFVKIFQIMGEEIDGE